MKTIVSISPVRVEADSRTFKQAASIKRFGYNSIVVEGEASNLDRNNLPFELHSLSHAQARNNTAEPVAGTEATEAQNGNARVKLFLERLGLMPLIRSRHVIGGFVTGLSRYLYRHCLLPLQHTPPASLYVLHSPLQFPAVYFLTRRYKAAFIYDAHDFYGRIEEPEQQAASSDRWLRSIYGRIESLCVKRAAAVVTVSEGVAELQRKAFGRQPVVIRNCQDPRLDQSPPRSIRTLLGLEHAAFLLVTVGQAKPGQAVTEAFEAIQTLPREVHLAFVGNGYEQHLPEIQSKGLSGRVHLVPAVKPYEVVPFIRSADAGLILYYPRSANYANCLPNGFFQSVMAELPLLYPELRDIKKIADQYRLGIAIDPQSPESIRAGAMELFTNRDRLQVLKENARNAKQELSWEKEEVIFRDLISATLRDNNAES